MEGAISRVFVGLFWGTSEGLWEGLLRGAILGSFLEGPLGAMRNWRVYQDFQIMRILGTSWCCSINGFGNKSFRFWNGYKRSSSAFISYFSNVSGLRSDPKGRINNILGHYINLPTGPITIQKKGLSCILAVV